VIKNNMDKKRKDDFLWFALALLICLGVGALGSIFTAPAISGWYASLIKPSFNPPNWLFSPVWTTLFILMGVALFLILRRPKNIQYRRQAVSLFIVQLFLNLLWSFFFFFLQNPGAALVEIAILWMAILLSLIYGAKVNRAVLWLLLPYLLWVSFASFLNYSIWALN